MDTKHVSEELLAEAALLDFDEAFQKLFDQQPGLGINLWLLRDICLIWFSFGVNYQARRIINIHIED